MALHVVWFVGLLLTSGAPSDESASRIGAGDAGTTHGVGSKLKIELPRDVRIILVGVPSTAAARAALENVSTAVSDWAPGTVKDAEFKAHIYFRLGKLDESLATVTKALREQSRFKGLEAYRELANELETRAESLSALCGDSPAPVVDEGDDAGARKPVVSQDKEFADQLRRALAGIDGTLQKVEAAVRSDETRKLQLEKNAAAVANFIAQLKAVMQEIETASEAEGEFTIDVNGVVQGVRSLIDMIRELKEQKARHQPQEPSGRKKSPQKHVQQKVL